MTGMIINNGIPGAVTVEHDDVKHTFPDFQSACEYADTVREKRFPQWPIDQQSFPFLESFDEERCDRVASSHGDGEHYRVGHEWLKLYDLLGGAE